MPECSRPVWVRRGDRHAAYSIVLDECERFPIEEPDTRWGDGQLREMFLTPQGKWVEHLKTSVFEGFKQIHPVTAAYYIFYSAEGRLPPQLEPYRHIVSNLDRLSFWWQENRVASALGEELTPAASWAGPTVARPVDPDCLSPGEAPGASWTEPLDRQTPPEAFRLSDPAALGSEPRTAAQAPAAPQPLTLSSSPDGQGAVDPPRPGASTAAPTPADNGPPGSEIEARPGAAIPAGKAAAVASHLVPVNRWVLEQFSLDSWWLESMRLVEQLGEAARDEAGRDEAGRLMSFLDRTQEVLGGSR
jgi:hypothetical protein